MKAVLKYECTESGHEQTATLTVEGDFDAIGNTTMNLDIEFKPAVSDDTSDPTGLLSQLIESMQRLGPRKKAASV